MVVKVVFHTLHVLIVFVSLAGDENDVALFGHHAGCAYSLAAVDDADNLFHLLLVETCQHVVDDGLRFFKARVVAGYDNAVALFYCLLSHEWSFALVAVAAGTTYGDDMSLAGAVHECRGRHQVHLQDPLQ